ncbi:hypothetical protein JOD45_001358 [Scopulibacillus daqui]|uniref:Uncharacterized protein n=1 Tax=Scopulibacillus daqui TaxID=1469162 RepID=A0ABS2PYP0_9BACL|nr:hypothetical protein [Scopulibacillus daqui]
MVPVVRALEKKSVLCSFLHAFSDNENKKETGQ